MVRWTKKKVAVIRFLLVKTFIRRITSLTLSDKTSFFLDQCEILFLSLLFSFVLEGDYMRRVIAVIANFRLGPVF